MLNQSEAAHQETVAATLKPESGPSQNLTITKPPNIETMPKSDFELARAAAAEGKEVELNDDNQIVDKRELLSAGLNLSAPNTRRLGLHTTTKSKEGEQVQAHRAVGSAASRREINERRQREIRQQLEEEESRVVEQQEREERERTERVVAKRNQESDVQSARERYLARKKRRVEDDSAETAA
jgi:coiled-coil domain-containing protein 55